MVGGDGFVVDVLEDCLLCLFVVGDYFFVSAMMSKFTRDVG